MRITNTESPHNHVGLRESAYTLKNKIASLYCTGCKFCATYARKQWFV